MNSLKELIGKAARHFSAAGVSRACVFSHGMHHAKLIGLNRMRNPAGLNAFRRGVESRRVRSHIHTGKKCFIAPSLAAEFAFAPLRRTHSLSVKSVRRVS
jgi:hypothetical protein